MNEDKYIMTDEEYENYYKNRPPNGCTCSACMHSWHKRQEFDTIEDKEAYYKQRIENYEVDDLVFDTTRDITDGDVLFWCETEEKLHDRYRDTFGCLGQYSPMLDYGDMGKDVSYEPSTSKEDRARNFYVDIELIFANAISDNPKLELMTDGETKIFEQLRTKVYLDAESRTNNSQAFKDIMQGMFDRLQVTTMKNINKTITYKGCEIHVSRDKCLGGWPMWFYGIYDKDGYEIAASFEDSNETLVGMVESMKNIVDDYLAHPELYKGELGV